MPNMTTSRIRSTPEYRALIQERNELANALGKVCGRIDELEALKRTAPAESERTNADVAAALKFAETGVAQQSEDAGVQVLKELSLLLQQRASLERAMQTNQRDLWALGGQSRAAATCTPFTPDRNTEEPAHG